MKELFERRKSIRTSINNSVIIKNQHGEVFSGVSINISAGGLMFSLQSTNEIFKIGDLIDIAFVPSLLGAINIKAEICYIARRPIIDRQEIRYGNKFLIAKDNQPKYPFNDINKDK